jgi:hypothetical protein
VSGRQYDGPALDGTVQRIDEAPYWQGDGETVDVVDDEPAGDETAKAVPVPSGDPRPGHDGQTTLDEWGWSC